MSFPTSLSVKLKLPNRVQPEVMPQPGKEGRYTNKMHYIKKHLLDEISKKKFALDFLEPVDTEVLKVPTYYKTIDTPMDVGTILKRVQNNYYRNVDEAVADFQLIIHNCFVFNQEGDVVYRKGQKMEKFFKKVLKGMPKGPEVLCNKDPKATGPTRSNPTNVQTERMCRDVLKKLQNLTSQSDPSIRSFFNAKWDLLAKKLEKPYFKTFDEFRSHVDGIFMKYHDTAKSIYEKAFNLPGSWTISVSSANGGSPLADSDLDELMKAAQLAESGLMQFLQSPSYGNLPKARTAVEAFSETITKAKAKLQAAKKSSVKKSGQKQKGSPNQEEEPIEGVRKPAMELLNRREVDSVMAVRHESSDEEEPTKLIGDSEQSSLQKSFTKLPQNAMGEIIHMVQQLEEKSLKDDQLCINLRSIGSSTMVMMKRAVPKVSRAYNKVNVKDMPAEELQGLRRDLEEQLLKLSTTLNDNRRRGNASTANARLNSTKTAARKKPSNPLAAKLNPPPVKDSGQGFGTGVGKCRNLSDTSDDSSGRSSPQFQPQGDSNQRMNKDQSNMNNKNPPQNEKYFQPNFIPGRELKISSSSSSCDSQPKSKSAKKSGSRSSSSSSSGSNSSSGSGSGSSSSSSSSSSSGSSSRSSSSSSSSSSSGSRKK
ncbi:bromodomain testis-specific protein [Drosophila eugracilis]|uniref:bromodomain testis-specific protein n=1 Tax=Drosophila eugracilis TaxID=29029 RepID=UPI001BD98619|nr:bromodomain testis-specific protein [Drosophila eugracilis]